MKLKYSTPIIISVILFILSSGFASAQLGQAGGTLNFGEIPRGGKETLSYGVINTGNEPLLVEFELEFPPIATVEPKAATIPANSWIPVFVTVHMPLNVEPGTVYNGHILVKQSSGGNTVGGIGFNVAVVKSINSVAGKEIAPPQAPEPPKPAEPPYFVIFILSIMAILFLYRDPFGWRKKKKAKR